MRLILFFVASLLIFNASSAQQPRIYIVKAGEVPSEVLPVEAMFQYPQFKQGIVYLRDGSASTAKLNYNIMLNEMQFITNRGDTLAIAYPETIKNITIDSTLYYYDKTYIQIIAQVDSFKLGMKQLYVQSPYRTRGGYDAPTAAGAITTYSSISSSSVNARLQIKKDVQFEKEVSYLVSNQFNRFFKADKKSFLNIFPKRKAEIENYMSQYKIEYSKEPDLEKLLKFCVSLN
ncbi:MAG: hypothetical protein M3040_07205 [Bacteroidota bacterium]|nr:hypothetical protein [Bacteroidota bacterium]